MIAGPPVWVTELAARFWATVGDPPPFPRDLRAVLCWLPELHVVGVPHLTLASAADRFARYGVPCPAGATDRPLAGCFAGHAGVGVILFDPTLAAAEVRFTLAHEVAHYLRDYDAPRRKVAARLGAAAVEVLDGRRPATADERLSGALRGIAVGRHPHFLDRDRCGRVVAPDARAAEDAADRLAFELLAPVAALASDGVPARAALAARLATEFGLPAAEAARYAAALAR